jgi:hypothetical protein
MKKRCATEAAQRCKNDSWQRLLHNRYRLKRLEASAVNAGEAWQSARTPKEKPSRLANRWNKCGPA